MCSLSLLFSSVIGHQALCALVGHSVWLLVICTKRFALIFTSQGRLAFIRGKIAIAYFVCRLVRLATVMRISRQFSRLLRLALKRKTSYELNSIVEFPC
jgi:hypothetical protein